MADQRQGKKRARYNGRGKALFRLKINEVKDDLKLGSRRWAYESRWAEELGVSYSQFARYIQEFITDEPPPAAAHVSTAAPVVQPRPAPAIPHHPAPIRASDTVSTPRQAPRETKPRFHFDPTEAHRRNDLT